MPNRRTGWILSLASLLAAGWLSAAHASDRPTTVYTGTLGKQTIVMELPLLAGEIFDARYFYTRHRVDIGFGGNMTADGHLSLVEDPNSNGFELTRQPDGGLKGEWKGQDGRSLPVLLHPAILPSLPANASDYLKQARRNSPYVYLRLIKMKLVREEQQSFMNHRLQWWREPGSGIQLFQIEDGYPDAQRQRINRALMNRLWREVNRYYACIDGDGALGGGKYQQRIEPALLSASVVSAKVHTFYYCGGAHGGTDRTSINLDAHTGDKLWLDDILWLGKGRPFHYEPIPDEPDDSQANLDRLGHWADHQEQVFVPWLTAQLKKRYPKQMAGGKDQCSYTDYPDAWVFTDWYLTPKGVFFFPTFPHVTDICTEIDGWSLLPYSEIRKHPGRLRLILP